MARSQVLTQVEWPHRSSHQSHMRAKARPLTPFPGLHQVRRVRVVLALHSGSPHGAAS